ncbi:MAG: hypothetical protein EXS09_12200 [Gemmataceae bacterium]|nr:hypothetical protein [Gemmataceae bacterium]
MPWRVGLDEAGYGPNLGPLVLASTSCHVPDGAPACLWTILEKAVCRRTKRKDGRLLIDDSKKVNQGTDGLARLEQGVLSVLNLQATTLQNYLETVAIGNTIADLNGEHWHADVSLPVEVDPEDLKVSTANLVEATTTADVRFGPIHTVAIPTPRFNRLLDEWQLKSGVLATGVIALLQAALRLPGEEAVYVAVDKLGGRNSYAPLLNEAFGGWVRTLREGAELSEYAIDGLSRPVFVRFEPRADGSHLNVALASMAAKYLREVLMMQFNRYWESRVPGIKPTAGYPVDAARFFAEIRNTLTADGTHEKAVWRAK